MNLKFWERFQKKSDETIISVIEAESSKTRQIYVSAQTSEKALGLYEKLRETSNK